MIPLASVVENSLTIIIYLTLCLVDNSVNPPLSPSLTPKKTSEKVIVIGAGFAGLSAAKTLQNQGYEVQILEARNRIGGRVWSEPFENHTIELGASWIHGIENNPLYLLAKELGVTVFTSHFEHSILYRSDGSQHPLSNDEINSIKERIETFCQFLCNRLSSVSLLSVLNLARLAGIISPVSDIGDYLIHTLAEDPNGADAADLSIDNYKDGEPMEGDEVLVTGGYKTLIDHLAKGLKIDLNCEVATIDYSGAAVIRITTREKHVYQADRVIVALPLGVLQSMGVRFIPQLPEVKRDALKKLNAGSVNKVWLRFPEIFWDDKELIEYASPVKGYFTEWFNLAPANHQPELVAFLPGKYGAELEQLSDKDVLRNAMNVLNMIYHDRTVPEPVAYRITRWHKDRYARGSYSSLGVDGKFRHREILAEPLEGSRVFFAGEHLSRFPGTTHGAYLSGERAAKELISQKMFSL